MADPLRKAGPLSRLVESGPVFIKQRRPQVEEQHRWDRYGVG